MHTMRTKLLIAMAVVIWGLGMLHVLALTYVWYWLFPWFDLLTHFLGGVFVGLAVVWFVFHSRYITAPAFVHRHALVSVLAGILVIGGLWEVYEYVVRVALNAPFEQNYVFDTSLDLLMDTLGAIAGYGVYLWLAQSGASGFATQDREPSEP